MNFGEASARFYQSYDRAAEQKADARANEILAKMTPEQIRAAKADGTLLLQDDQRGMRALNFKTGRMSAYEVDTDIQQKVAQGAFKTQKDLVEYRNKRLNEALKSYADAYGIDAQDEDYTRGFSADIVQRSAAVYDHHARFLSQQIQATAQMQTASDLGGFFADEGFLRSPTGPQDFANYFTASLASGAIPTDGAAVSALRDALSQNSAQPGADAFFKNLGDKEVVLYGRPTKIRDIVGPEVLESYQVKAGEAAFRRNRDLDQKFTFGIQDALAQSDPHAGLSKLDRIQGGLNQIQSTNMVTSQTQALNAARGRLLAQIAADSQKRVKEMDKQIKSDNRLGLFEAKYAQRIAGDNISTDWRTFETTPDTGDFKEEDAANFAIRKLDEIDRMDLTPQEKDAEKLKYLRVDPANGPFRKHFETLTDDAMRQFQGLIAADSVIPSEANTARIRELQRIYKSDPDTLSALLTPEQTVLMERIDLMERNGIGLETIIDADRRMKGMSREEQILQERKWGELLTGSDSSLPYLPANLRNAARTLYGSELFRTGDEQGALNTVKSWLEKSTTSFTAKDGKGDDKPTGMVQKRTLMVDPQDAQSWRQGRDVINEAVSKLVEKMPWLNPGDITITESPQGILLNDPSSTINLPPITTDYLRQYHLAKQAEAQRAAQKDREERADKKIDKYKQEQARRKAQPFSSLDPAIGTLEGAAGFRDR
ncbi:hypothetical protein [Pseudomonas guariconensis]|uniref:hypothetical protein n=1 Tax=Pseudomonas guariconensis TaxID=1288410 RepID=UPI002FE66E20